MDLNEHRHRRASSTSLAQLAQRGFVASFTLANTKGIDILVINPSLNHFVKLEVKTTNKPPGKERTFCPDPAYAWPMSEKHETISDPRTFYCFVVLQGHSTLPLFFIVPLKLRRRVRA